MEIIAIFGIGLVAGLRSLTAPAVVSWAAYFGWINVAATPYAFLASPIVAGVITLLAAGELLADKHPKMAPRTSFPGLTARVVTGGFCGLVISSVTGNGVVLGLAAGVIGALIGTFGGYHIRRNLGQKLQVNDLLIAIPEDLIAIGLALLLVYPGVM
jgi:uncharacterized membrane protein